MAKPKIKPQVPGATPPPTEPTFEQLKASVGQIAKVEMNVDLIEQSDFDALDPELQAKLVGYYHRFKAAPPDPTAAEIQAGADQVIDAALQIAQGHGPNVRQHDIDATKLTAPVMSADGWVCPAPKKA